MLDLSSNGSMCTQRLLTVCDNHDMSAATTNYAHLYARGYYAHAAGATSFDIARLPPIVAATSARHGRRVLDIGGGNGALAGALNCQGVRTLTLDAAQREAPDFLHCDLAKHNADTARDMRKQVVERLGESYLATCFDVAEHIDVEHLADFLLNLAALVDQELLLSLSTRPSSAANRYHASILPIETWQRLFALAGFASAPHEELQALRSDHRFSGSDANIAAVAYWQRRNPFRDKHVSHQHYLLLTRDLKASPLDEGLLRRSVRDLTDSTYRHLKREMVVGCELPTLNYHVNFIQDWSFVRSLMDIWPAGRLRVSLRRDIIAKPYLHLLEGFLDRTGCPFAVTGSVAEGVAAMERWGGLDEALVMTATEGLPSMTHVMGSLLLLEARKRGARTLSLQHGMTVSRYFAPAAALVGTWDEGSAKTMRSRLARDAGFEVKCTGSPKFLDALLPASSAALRNRLGNCAADFSQVILVGLNLHWAVHVHGASDTYAWIDRLTRANSETLFVIRPHPDDGSVYEVPALLERANIVIADEMLLQCLDWPVARLVRAADGVISTYSTLVIDAAAAGKPVVLLPAQGSARDAASFLPASLPWPEGVDALPLLSADEWSSGALPAVLQPRTEPRIRCDTTWFDPSWTCLTMLIEVAQTRRIGASDAAERSVAQALMTAARWHSLDDNPHRDRERVCEAISRFVSGGPPLGG